jgi:hypothetical protein
VNVKVFYGDYHGAITHIEEVVGDWLIDQNLKIGEVNPAISFSGDSYVLAVFYDKGL